MRRSLPGHERDRRTRAPDESGSGRDRRPGRDHPGSVVAACVARRAAGDRADAGTALLPAVSPLLRGDPAPLRRRPARGLAAATVCQHRRIRLPRGCERRLRASGQTRLAQGSAASCRSSHCWPPARVFAPVVRRTRSATPSPGAASSAAHCLLSPVVMQCDSLCRGGTDCPPRLWAKQGINRCYMCLL